MDKLYFTLPCTSFFVQTMTTFMWTGITTVKQTTNWTMSLHKNPKGA